MHISAGSLVLGLGLGLSIGGLLAYLWMRAVADRAGLDLARRLSTAETVAEGERTRRTELEAEAHRLQEERSELAQALAVARREVEHAEREIADQRTFLETSRQELENSFKALAASVLEGSTKQFLGLAEERFSRTRSEAEADLEQRRQAIEGMLTPLKETLVRLESRTGEIERARVDAYAKIDQQINSLVEQTVRLQEKTTSLNSALRGTQVRGRWGEMALRNIAELSGMTAHCDFEEQSTLSDGRRPDMVVNLPGRRMIAVDAKAPLTAYLQSMEEETEARKNAALDRHVADLRGHVRALAAREYAENLGGQVDLVVMFLPGDPFLAAAFSRAPGLQTEALRSKVLIATPSTLIALLRTVAIYWQQRSVAENAEKIAATARTLYERVAIFAEHLDKVGKGLRGATDAYNQAVASFERRFLPMARQLEDLKVTEQTTRQLEMPGSLDESPREVPSS